MKNNVRLIDTHLSQEIADRALTMVEVKRLLQKAKKAYEKAQEAEAAVFQALDAMRLDLGASSEAENADNLGEAVTCYLNYGEFSLEGLLSEIRAQYTQTAHPSKPNSAPTSVQGG